MDTIGLVLLPGAGLGPGLWDELDSGHLPMISQPDALAKILTSFLSELAGP